MIRLITTTALVTALSTSAFAVPADHPAAGLKTTLQNVYDAFDNNANIFKNRKGKDAAGEYAKLLHHIDNLGGQGDSTANDSGFDADVLMKDGEPVALPVDANGDPVSPAKLGTPETVVDFSKAFVDNLVAAVKSDLFSPDGLNLTADEIMDITQAAADFEASTPGDAEALTTFNTAYDKFARSWNGAVDALSELRKVTVETYTDYQLNGVPFGYASYTDYVIDVRTPVAQEVNGQTIMSSYKASGTSSSITVDGQVFAVSTNPQTITAPDSTTLTLVPSDGAIFNDFWQRAIDQAEIWLAAQ